MAELTVGKNTLMPDQANWLEAFRAAEVPAFDWRPVDWPEIEQVLEGRE